jgi:MFS family permease
MVRLSGFATSVKVGRKPLLVSSYLAGALGLLILAFAVPLWQFWFVASLVATLSVSLSVGSAMVTDLVPVGALGRALALFNNTPWLAGIIGFAAAGSLIESFDMTATFLWIAFMPLIAIALLASLRQSITLPEMIIWWVSFPMLVLGLWFSVRYRLRQISPILIFPQSSICALLLLRRAIWMSMVLFTMLDSVADRVRRDRLFRLAKGWADAGDPVVREARGRRECGRHGRGAAQPARRGGPD